MGNIFETQCIKIRLKPGTTDYVIRWIKELNRDEIYEVLRLETVVVESLFLERAEDGDYLIMYARAESLVKANEAMMNSDHPHFASVKQLIADTWGEIKAFELLADFDRTAEVK